MLPPVITQTVFPLSSTGVSSAAAEDTVDPATYDKAVDDFWATLREVTEIVPMGKHDLLHDGNSTDIDTVVVGYPCRKKREDREQVWRF